MALRNGSITKFLFIGGGIIFLLLTLGFFFQMSWATALWPWPDTRLSYIFIAAITAAVAAPMIWIGLSGEYGAANAGAVSLAIAAAGTSIYLFYLNSRQPNSQVWITAVVFAIFVLLNLLIYLWSRRIPIRDQRDEPLMVEFTLLLFIIVLVLVGSALLRQTPLVFPWPVNPESSVIFGLMFFAAAIYFFSALRVPKWHSARGQLLGFLAYDLVLIGPFLSYFSSVAPEHRTSLSIFTLLIIVSALFCSYYLFINRTTRPWSIEEAPQAEASPAN
jgi:hypothetical protein